MIGCDAKKRVLGDGNMSSTNDYRSNAEDCLRRAEAAADDRDGPLWATMAQSWLRLAEHADRIRLDREQEEQAAN
jgi:hypothetical protein